MLDGPDDIQRTKSRIAAEEDALAGGFKRGLVDNRGFPLVEFHTDIALDPGEGIVLADRQNDIVARQGDFAGLAGVGDLAALVDIILHHLECHPGQLAVFGDEGFWRMIDDDLDILMLGVFQLPG